MIVIPKGVHDFDALHKCRQQRPVNLVMKVTIDGELLGEQTKSLTLRSVNDCPWAVVQGEDEPPMTARGCSPRTSTRTIR